MSSNQYHSPLRYPGGKASLYDFLVRTLDHNNINYGVYAEGFAGGAGAALKLLIQEDVGDIFLNDKDRFITDFWNATLNHTDELCQMIHDSHATVEQWQRGREIIFNIKLQEQLSPLEMGFWGFFLNRINRSGILTGGPIGGIEQESIWKIDARYNKADLIRRIQRVALYRERIHVTNLDVVKFIQWFKKKGFRIDEVLLYLDPPYVGQGKQLYKHYFEKKDHIRLANYLQRHVEHNWLVSYDDHPLIHQAYREVTKNIFEFNYYANRTKLGRELVISSKQFLLPESYTHYSRKKEIEHTNYERKAV